MSAPFRIMAVQVLAVSAWIGFGHAKAADKPPPADRAESHRRYGLDPSTSIESRVGATPSAVLEMFKEGGRPAPTAHILEPSERLKLEAAVAALPPLHRRVLGERLRVVSFLDRMPNTALTSTVNPKEPFRLFDVTVNAAILRQDVSEWLTQKERTCFGAADSSMSVRIDAGTKLGALVYVLLHEATHIVDFSLQITPASARAGEPSRDGKTPAGAFIDGVWSELSRPVPRFRDPLRERVPFYAEGGAIPIDQAPAVYESLRRTPFVSLYGGRNWLDDLAEYVTVYHLTEVLKQPYRIVIRKEGRDVFVYEPMKSDLVRGRVDQMKRFYEGGPDPGATPTAPGRSVSAAAGGT